MDVGAKDAKRWVNENETSRGYKPYEHTVQCKPEKRALTQPKSSTKRCLTDYFHPFSASINNNCDCVSFIFSSSLPPFVCVCVCVCEGCTSRRYRMMGCKPCGHIVHCKPEKRALTQHNCHQNDVPQTAVSRFPLKRNNCEDSQVFYFHLLTWGAALLRGRGAFHPLCRGARVMCSPC